MNKNNIVIGDTVKVRRDDIEDELKILYVWGNGLFLCDDNEIYTKDEIVEVVEEKSQTKNLDKFDEADQDILMLCREGVSEQYIMNRSKYFYDRYEINEIKLKYKFDELYKKGFIYKILNKYKSMIKDGVVYKV